MKLRSCLVYIFLTITLFSMIVTGLLIFNGTKDVLQSVVFSEIRSTLNSSVNTLQNGIDQIIRQVTLTTQYPSIQGIIRAQNNGGVDPKDNSSLQDWKQRLENIFASKITVFPYLFQIRYLNEHGKELVRVDNVGGKIDIVDEARLQDKSHRSYFQETITYAPDQTYISSIDLNKEHGKIQIPYVPVMRVAKSVVDENDKTKKGIVIFNIYIEHLLNEIKRPTLAGEFFIINQEGIYIYYPDNIKKQFGSLLNQQDKFFRENPNMQSVMTVNNEKWHFEKGERAYKIWKRIYFDPADKSHYWTFVFTVDERVIYESLSKIQKITIFICGFTAFIIGLVSLLMANSLAVPLERLDRIAQRIQQGDLDRTVDADLMAIDNEIGTLAKSFNQMVFNLIESNRNLEEKVQERTKELSKMELLQKFWLNETTDGVWDINLTDKDLYMSARFKQEFGYENYEVPNTLEGWRQIIVPEDVVLLEKMFKEHIQNKKPFNLPVRYKHKNGSIVWVMCRGVAVKNHRGEYVRMLGTHTNINQLKKTEEKLLNITEELSRSNKELEQFAYVASHDLQEPIRKMVGFTQLLQNRLADKLDPSTAEFMKYVVDGSLRMQALIQDLLQFSRVGQGELFIEEFSVTDVVQETLNDLELAIRDNQVDVVVNDLPNITSHRLYVSRVFQNLISNAIKYHNMGKIPHVIISFEQEDNNYIFSVKDNGIGISPEYHERIFKIFQRLHGREEYPGTGIGLSICHKIVSRLGGEIWVESQAGEGSNFKFRLPMKYEERKYL